MKKRLIPIYSVLVVAIVLLAAFVPSCGEGTGTIYVHATYCGQPWQGAVNYTLTPTSGTPVSGTAVDATHSGVAADTWTCAYVSGGPVGYCLDSIKPSASQTLSADGNITFILDFELCEDAAILFDTWTWNGIPCENLTWEAVPCNWIDAHFKQWVDGCEDYNVTLNETDWLKITQTPNGAPAATVYVVDDDCAVNKTIEGLGPSPVKVSQTPSINNLTVQKGANTTLVPNEPTLLDVHTQWQLVKCLNYTKAINWFGIWIGEYMPEVHNCTVFELLLPTPGFVYVFTLQTSADVALVGDTDVDPGNNNATSGNITLVVDLT